MTADSLSRLLNLVAGGVEGGGGTVTERGISVPLGNLLQDEK
jgi:hypothetical protein